MSCSHYTSKTEEIQRMNLRCITSLMWTKGSSGVFSRTNILQSSWFSKKLQQVCKILFIIYSISISILTNTIQTHKFQSDAVQEMLATMEEKFGLLMLPKSGKAKKNGSNISLTPKGASVALGFKV